VILACVSFAAGLALFDFTFVHPIRGVPMPYNSSAHVIAHPLVLGLAAPPNELSAREGIEWKDATGLVLAQRIKPDVTFLGEGYERALFTYYRHLWAAYPREMAAIYLRKAMVTSQAVGDFIGSNEKGQFWRYEKNGRWLGLAAWPATAVAQWIPLPLAFGAMLIVGWVRGRRGEADRAFLYATFAIFGLLAFAESSAVLGGIILWYSSILLYCTVFVGLLVYQALLDVASNAVRRRRSQA
jgi:hypothetical protein